MIRLYFNTLLNNERYDQAIDRTEERKQGPGYPRITNSQKRYYIHHQIIISRFNNFTWYSTFDEISKSRLRDSLSL